MVAYYSKTFSPPQRNYCVTRRELLAVVMAVNHFRPYLYGQEFRLIRQEEQAGTDFQRQAGRALV